MRSLGYRRALWVVCVGAAPIWLGCSDLQVSVVDAGVDAPPGNDAGAADAGDPSNDGGGLPRDGAVDTGAPECVMDDDCIAVGCMVATCNTETGTCDHAADAALCTEGSPCTEATCNAEGECEYVAEPDLCGDTGNPCTIATCDASTGCGETNVEDGATCDDGAGTCQGGVCEPTASACEAVEDCTNGSDCAVPDCVDGWCQYAANDEACDDCNECTENVCDPEIGCQHPTLPDGAECAVGQCVDGRCDPEVRQPAFRIDSLILADPHVVYDRIIQGVPFWPPCAQCWDYTNVSLDTECYGEDMNILGLNPDLEAWITEDNRGDCFLDLSYLLAFEPEVQVDGGGGALAVTEGLCSPADPDRCREDPEAVANGVTSYTSRASGECLSAIPDTLGPRPYPDGITIEPHSPSGNCFVSDATELTIRLPFPLHEDFALWYEPQREFHVPLQEVRMAGVWQGDEATGVSQGLLRGFVTMRDADQAHVDATLEFIGAFSFNLGRDLLPDGGDAHGCGSVDRTFPGGDTTGQNTHCAGGDARDLLDPDAPASYDNCGWWLYLNWTATRAHIDSKL
jgi:hypothetical protein